MKAFTVFQKTDPVTGAPIEPITNWINCLNSAPNPTSPANAMIDILLQIESFNTVNKINVTVIQVGVNNYISPFTGQLMFQAWALITFSSPLNPNDPLISVQFQTDEVTNLR